MFSNGAACVWSKSNTKTAAASLLVLVSMNRPFQVCFPFGKIWLDEYFNFNYVGTTRPKGEYQSQKPR